MACTGAAPGSFSPIAKNIDNLLSTPMSQASTALEPPSPFSQLYGSPSDLEEADCDGQVQTGKHLFFSLGDPAWPQDQPEAASVPHVLSPDGRALDHNGAAASFDFAKDASPSHSTKVEAIDSMRAFRAVRVAHAACEAEAAARAEDTDAFSTNASEFEVDDKAGWACSVDAVGVLRGTVFVTSATRATVASTVKRVKLLHRLRVRDRSSKDGSVFCVDPDGHVCLHLAPMPCIDPSGSVHWPNNGPVIDIQSRQAVWDLSGEEVDMYAAV